jgi:DNA-binding FadR family transcriptional regulator
VLTRDYQEGLQIEHARIMQAISVGDTAEARDAMRAHLTNSQDRYRARLHKTPKPMARR